MMIFNHIKILVMSIKTLGIVTGIRYFNVYLQALRDPSFIIAWADACDNYARKLEFFNKEPTIAEAARHWAITLRECNKKIAEYELKIDNEE